MKVLEGALTREDRMLDGETVFQLYDTFGFPVDLTADIARERGVRVDYAGFEAAMERQRERARAASKFQAGGERRIQRRRPPSSTATTRSRWRRKVVALYNGRACRCRSSGRRRRGDRGARPHAVLRGVGRPGRRQRRARRRVRHFRRRGHAEDPGRRCSATRACSRPAGCAVGDRVMAGVDADAPRAHHAQSLGDPPHAQGAARGAGHARAAEGLAGGCRADALRLLAQRADDRRADPAGRGDRQCRDPRQRRDDGAHHEVRRGDQGRRDGVLRRQVRRRGARARHRLLARAVRRHARRAHRRHRFLQGDLGGRHRRRRAPHRGDDRRGRARLGAGTGSEAQRGGRSAEDAAAGSGAEDRADPGQREEPGKGARRG